MSRRIREWSSQGCIYALGAVNADNLRAQAALNITIPPEYAMRNNEDLAALVISMVEKGQMASVIMERCGQPEWRSERLNNLVASFREGGVYNENTSIEFQRLLVATLLAYGHALIALGAHEGGPDSIAQKYEQVYICASLLRQLASSLMLRQHLLACQPLLSIPINTQETLEMYQLYTGFPLKGRHEDSSDDGDYEPFEAEMNPDETFLIWIRVQVAHLLALGTISRAFGSLSTKVPHISLFAVRYPQQPTMEPWTDTVDMLLSDPDPGLPLLDAESVKNAILDRTKCSTLPNRHAIFKNFYPIHSQQPPAFGNAVIHCEIALTSLAKYARQALARADVDLISLLEVIFYLIVMPIHLTCCAEFEPKRHRGVTALLPGLLGAHRHL
jgi:hypothetical protein